LVSASGGLGFSPDGGSIVAVLQAAGSDIWTYELRRGARIKMTDQGPINTTPTWSPDGTQVAFNSAREPAGIYVQSLDAAGHGAFVDRIGLIDPLTVISALVTSSCHWTGGRLEESVAGARRACEMSNPASMVPTIRSSPPSGRSPRFRSCWRRPKGGGSR